MGTISFQGETFDVERLNNKQTITIIDTAEGSEDNIHGRIVFISDDIY